MASAACWRRARSSSWRSVLRPQPDRPRRLKTYLGEQCVWLETTDDLLGATVDLPEAMLRADTHREPIPDLIIAAVTQAHNAVLVVYDRDFDDIARRLGGRRVSIVSSTARASPESDILGGARVAGGPETHFLGVRTAGPISGR